MKDWSSKLTMPKGQGRRKEFGMEGGKTNCAAISFGYLKNIKAVKNLSWLYSKIIQFCTVVHMWFPIYTEIVISLVAIH